MIESSTGLCTRKQKWLVTSCYAAICNGRSHPETTYLLKHTLHAMQKFWKPTVKQKIYVFFKGCSQINHETK